MRVIPSRVPVVPSRRGERSIVGHYTSGMTDREATPNAVTRSGRIAAAFYIAWRNLTGERRRWAISTVALAVSAMLVIFLEGTSRWLTTSATAYVDHTGSQLIVAEKGIDDLLFAQSAFPTATMAQLRQISGVASADPVIGVNGIVAVNGTRAPVYLVGFDSGRPGGPWLLDSGSDRPNGDEVVLDRGLARVANVRVGDSLTLFGHRLRVVGTSAATDAAGDFFMFVPIPVAQAVAGTDTVSYGLVQLQAGASEAGVMSAIDRLPGVHALPTATVAANDRELITQSFAQPVQVLAIVGLIAGVLIAGIVLYTATVEHSRDYAVMKAVGAGAGVLYGSALLQSIVLSFFGVLLGWGIATALAAGFDAWNPVVESQLDIDLVLTVAGVILAVNLLAALLPVRHVSRIDPQEVFKA
jgi:putative ABC transport system permease protein